MTTTIDSSRNNQRRAGCARAALAAYQRASHDGQPCEAEPTFEMLIDLLTDLRHWAASAGIEFRDAVRISEGHFVHEQSLKD